MKIKRSQFQIDSYEEFLNEHKKYSECEKCFVAGCNEPGYYEGGDSRFYCGMCGAHANMKNAYRRYLEERKRKIEIRMMWCPDQQLRELYEIVITKLKEL